jgi:hypothetical protein
MDIVELNPLRFDCRNMGIEPRVLRGEKRKQAQPVAVGWQLKFKPEQRCRGEWISRPITACKLGRISAPRLLSLIAGCKGELWIRLTINPISIN